MYVILPANKTVVSGYNSAMGGLERYELVFRAPMLHNRVCSWGYSLSRTLDGNKDEIMAFDLLAVETMYSCCRETFQSYSINTKKGNTMKAIAEIAKITPCFVMNTDIFTFDIVGEVRSP
jgi:hypothetical protein